MRWTMIALGLGMMSAAGACHTADEYEHVGADDISTPAWAERAPTAAQIYQAYPSEAVKRGVAARVMLDCTVLQSRKLMCSVADEGVAGYGFGAAALKVSQLFLVKPAAEGSPTAVGRQVRVPIRFAVATE